MLIRTISTTSAFNYSIDTKNPRSDDEMEEMLAHAISYLVGNDYDPDEKWKFTDRAQNPQPWRPGTAGNGWSVDGLRSRSYNGTTVEESFSLDNASHDGNSYQSLEFQIEVDPKSGKKHVDRVWDEIEGALSKAEKSFR
jgi:hypothetical protein